MNYTDLRFITTARHTSYGQRLVHFNIFHESILCEPHIRDKVFKINLNDNKLIKIAKYSQQTPNSRANKRNISLN